MSADGTHAFEHTGIMDKLVIWLIRKYQEKAPERIRSSCRYTPTCSEYMVGGIKKYGAIIGICKGIKRLLRCRPPHGGVDPP